MAGVVVGPGMSSKGWGGEATHLTHRLKYGYGELSPEQTRFVPGVRCSHPHMAMSVFVRMEKGIDPWTDPASIA